MRSGPDQGPASPRVLGLQHALEHVLEEEHAADVGGHDPDLGDHDHPIRLTTMR
jgi:hypothetical protein